jgi:NitT/TauT family transport system substrate-binding protein
MLERALALMLLSGATPMLAIGAETVTVRLDWLASGYHAPLFVAKERGLYAAQGLDVHFENGQGSLTTLQVVGAGNGTLGLASLSAISMAQTHGVPVVAIAGLIQRAPEAVLSLADSGIHSPKDLEGKRWGAVAGDEGQRLFIAYAARNHLDLNKIRKVTLSPSTALVALVRGDVDFICGWGMEEGLKIARLKPIAPPMLLAASGVNTMGTSIFVTRSLMQEKPDLLRRFMIATRQGAQIAAAEPQAAVDALLHARPEFDRAFVTAEIADLPEYQHTSASAGHPFGWLARSDVDGMLAVMREYYGLPATVTAGQLYTDRFMQ